MNQNDEFTKSERDRLNKWFPLDDSASQSIMWRMILDQRKQNLAANDDELVQLNRYLQTAERLNYCMANMPGRFRDFYIALGLGAESERSMRELSRLGDPMFIEPAQRWAQQKMTEATGGVRVRLGWRRALKHVLAMFGKKEELDDNGSEEPEGEPPDPDIGNEIDREKAVMWAEIERLKSENENLKAALDLAKTTHREERMKLEAERDALIAERDALRLENARLRSRIAPADRQEAATNAKGESLGVFARTGR
jgi:regulator of replication initiation timing